MSLYNNSAEKVKKGQHWTKLELESLESPTLAGTRNKTDFIDIHKADTKCAGFVPFEKGGNNPKRTKEAEDILQKAREKASYIEQEAYEKGFAQGEKDGLELGEKKALKLIENIDNILIELRQLKKEIPKQYEKEILDLIFAIAKKIVHREIATDKSILKDTIFNALHFAVEKSKVILRVNQEDLDYVEKLRTQLLAEVKDLKSLSIISDPSITRGGCLLETHNGEIDSSVETRLMKIYQGIKEAFYEKGP